MAKVFVTYEFESVNIDPSDKDDLATKSLITINKQRTYFKQAGVFTTSESVFVVLPWAVKSSVDDSKLQSATRTNFDESSLLIDTFFWLRDLTSEQFSIDANINSGRDFIYFCYLKSLEQLVASGLRFNVFRTTEDSINAIKGRWLIHRDIKHTSTPLKFTCDFSECDRNHPLLAVARVYLYQLSKKSGSNYIRGRALSLEKDLSFAVDLPNNTEAALKSALSLATTDKRFKEWLPWLKAISFAGLSNTGKNYFGLDLPDAGLVNDVYFPTSKFFEILVSDALKHIGFQVEDQVSQELLGGSYWVDANHVKRFVSGEEARQTHLGSRPDMIIHSENEEPLLVECKYKQLTVKTDNKDDPASMEGFETSDRNQILSFVLSRGNDTNFDTKNIILAFPVTQHETHPTIFPELRLSCKITSQGNEHNLAWKKGDPPSLSDLRIHFLPIDVHKLLLELRGVASHKIEISRIIQFFMDRKKLKSAA